MIRRSVVVAGAAALGATWLGACSASPAANTESVDDRALREIQAAVDLAEQHGQAMQAFGTRLVDYGKTPAGQQPQAQAIAAWGEHWQTDGKAMLQVCADIRRVMATNPPRPRTARSVELDRLEMQGQMLIGRGQALAEHGKAMQEITISVARQIGEPNDPWVRDGLADMTRQSAQMLAAGERLHAAGKTVEQTVTQLRRSVRGVG